MRFRVRGRVTPRVRVMVRVRITARIRTIGRVTPKVRDRFEETVVSRGRPWKVELGSRLY